MLSLIALVSLAFLLVVWVIYPLVMAALAMRRSATTAPSTAPDSTVSIIIATRDYEAVIRDRLADCAACAYEREKLDVVIAIDRLSVGANAHELSPGDGRMLADGMCTVVMGDEPGGKAATLNAAVRAARGEILVFTDTYQRFEPHTVRHLVAALEDPQVGASSGSLELDCSGRSRSLADRYWSYERWLRRCEARAHSPVGVTGAIWALRRSLWRALPPNLILDDVYAPMQVVLRGYRVAFAEHARAIETRRPGVTQEYRRKVRTLTGVIQLCIWLPAVLVPVRNPIWVQFIFHKLLRLLTPYWLLAILVWAGSLVMPWLAANPLGALGLVITGSIGGYYAGKSAGGLLRSVREGVASVVLLQVAVVVATVNGVRRRWDVWRA
jgi:cellulose synthase/poly-beta-1,6-N-acetylglucosamine synthase-like glycosyltransferase